VDDAEEPSELVVALEEDEELELDVVVGAPASIVVTLPPTVVSIKAAVGVVVGAEVPVVVRG